MEWTDQSKNLNYLCHDENGQICPFVAPQCEARAPVFLTAYLHGLGTTPLHCATGMILGSSARNGQIELNESLSAA